MQASMFQGHCCTTKVPSNQTVTITASYDGYSDTHLVAVEIAGTYLVYPLTGFEGKQVRARLWDDVNATFIPLGEMNAPNELLVRDLNAGQWYWLIVEEFDDASSQWLQVHANWISM